jgi:hypothetical protein
MIPRELSRRVAAGLSIVALLLATGCREQATPDGSGSSDTRAPRGSADTTAVNPLEFSEQVESLPESPQSCSVDSIDGDFGRAPYRSSETTMRVSGWLSDETQSAPAELIVAVHNQAHQYGYPAMTGTPRADVAKYFKAPGLRNSGFEINLDVSNIPSGSYQLLLIYRSGNQYIRCETDRQVVFG